MEDYEIPHEGPIRDTWDRVINALDWAFGAMLVGYLTYAGLKEFFR